MKIKYLGTAAAEGIPGLFCSCRVCRNALEKRGKEIKTRSQAIVDDKLLIDFPADTYLHVLQYGLDLREIHHCIVTHNHSDHFYPQDLWCRLEGIAHGIDETPLHVYVTAPGCEDAVARFGGNPRLSFHKVTPFVPFTVEEYRIVPLAADHDPATEPVIYIIEKDGQAMLYANDTGFFPESTWEYLESYGKTFAFVSLDCTGMALKDYRRSHMSLETNSEVRDRLAGMGRIDNNTVLYVNHFSHNGLLSHEELVEEAGKLGFLASCDGLEVEF